jgi:hypothetical protein
MFLLKVAQKFDEYAIPYAVVGGYAVAFHGAVRGTVDVDCIISWELQTLNNVVKAMGDLGLRSLHPIEVNDLFKNKENYIKAKNLIAWSFINYDNPLEQVDIIITHHFDKNEIKQVIVNSQTVNVVSKAHLIKMKEQSGREQDLIDIKSLRAIDEN